MLTAEAGDSPAREVDVANDDGTRLLVSEIAARMRLLLERAQLCLDQLDDSQAWYRPNPESNAVGNLVLHLVGNLRQWILGGIGGVPDARDRPAEFAATTGLTTSALKALLSAAVEDSCRTIEGMPLARVTERKVIQGEDTTISYALVMAVSHLGLHVGQMQYVAKMLLGSGYRVSWVPGAGR